MAASPEAPEKMKFQLTLRRRGISEQAVLRAMEEVPREIFVEAADRADAYRDSALGIACGQTISQPFVVAYMTEQLQLGKDHRVLEIGTGSGYQAAILSRLAKHVLTIERYRTLADSARKRLEKLGYYNIEVMFGDGFDVPAGAGNFERIIVTAAMEQIPESLMQRLEVGGILIACGALAPRGDNSIRSARPKFDSGSSGGTARSSAQNKVIRCQSTFAFRSAPRKIIAVAPPEIAQDLFPDPSPSHCSKDVVSRLLSSGTGAPTNSIR